MLATHTTYRQLLQVILGCVLLLVCTTGAWADAPNIPADIVASGEVPPQGTTARYAIHLNAQACQKLEYCRQHNVPVYIGVRPSNIKPRDAFRPRTLPDDNTTPPGIGASFATSPQTAYVLQTNAGDLTPAPFTGTNYIRTITFNSFQEFSAEQTQGLWDRGYTHIDGTGLGMGESYMENGFADGDFVGWHYFWVTNSVAVMKFNVTVGTPIIAAQFYLTNINQYSGDPLNKAVGLQFIMFTRDNVVGATTTYADDRELYNEIYNLGGGVADQRLPVTLRTGPNPPDSGACPLDNSALTCNACGTFNAGSGGLARAAAQPPGPSGNDPVNMATGNEAYMPGPDLDIYNPTGERVIFMRAYYSGLAKAGKCSPGLSPGWVHNYDLTLTAVTPGLWDALVLHYPKGTAEYLIPDLTPPVGQPSGFQTPPGANYFVTGVAASARGCWQVVRFTWRDQAVWEFTPRPENANEYVLTKITNRMGKFLTLAYDNNRLLQAVTNDRNTTLLTCTYDTIGQLSTIADAYARKVAYTFGTPNGLATPCLATVSEIASVSTGTPPMRYTFGYTPFSGQPLMHTITVPSPTGTGTATATINYDPTLGKVASRVDANGNRWEYAYGDAGTGTSTVTVKDPHGNVVQTWGQKYDQGKNAGITDANNSSSSNEYGNSNQPYNSTRVTEKDGKSTAYVYDNKGNVTEMTNPRGLKTRYWYDYSTWFFGRLIRMQVGNLTPTTYTYYEPNGLVRSVITAKPGSTTGETVTTSYTYDELGNILTVTRPGNNAAVTLTTSFNYTTDGNYTQYARIGQSLTLTSPAGRIIHFRFDARGNQVRITDELANATESQYNLADQAEEMRSPDITRDGVGFIRRVNDFLYTGGPKTRERLYNEQGMLVKQINYSYGPEGELLARSGDMEAVSYTYDALNRRKTFTDGRNNTTMYSYDAVGNLAQIQYPGGETTQFPSYDATGRLLERVDGNGVHTLYTYGDAEGHLTSISYPATPALDVEFSYDEYGRKTLMTDSTGVIAYSYTCCEGTLTSVTTHYTSLPEVTIYYTYYPDGTRKTMTISGTGTFLYEYNKAGQSVRLRNPFGMATTWQYAADGKLSRETLGNRAWTSFGYDAIGRITRLAHYSPKGRLLANFDNVSYDAKGNRLGFQATVPGLPRYSGMTTLSYDSKDQLLQEETIRYGGYTRSYAYDITGNPTFFAGISHPDYNENNQLDETSYLFDNNGNPTVYGQNHMSFDPENRLTEFRDANNVILLTAGYNGNGLRAWKSTHQGKVYFIYDGDKLVAELDATGVIQTVMTWGPSGLLARNSIWYMYDLHGSVVFHIDTQGKMKSGNLYDAWGVRFIGDDNAPYGYIGKWGYYTDSETGMIMCTHRYYDPYSGRFITRDPIGYDGGVNLYTYVKNRPSTRVDPSGYVEWDPDPFVTDPKNIPKPGTSEYNKVYDEITKDPAMKKRYDDTMAKQFRKPCFYERWFWFRNAYCMAERTACCLWCEPMNVDLDIIPCIWACQARWVMCIARGSF